MNKENDKKSASELDKKFVYKNGDGIYLPISIEGDIKTTSIVKENKGSFFLKTDKILTINNQKLLPGFIKIELAKFDRSSNWDENLAVKNSFEIFAKDSTNEMIKAFDEAYAEN